MFSQTDQHKSAGVQQAAPGSFLSCHAAGSVDTRLGCQLVDIGVSALPAPRSDGPSSGNHVLKVQLMLQEESLLTAPMKPKMEHGPKFEIIFIATRVKPMEVRMVNIAMQA